MLQWTLRKSEMGLTRPPVRLEMLPSGFSECRKSSLGETASLTLRLVGGDPYDPDTLRALRRLSDRISTEPECICFGGVIDAHHSTTCLDSFILAGGISALASLILRISDDDISDLTDVPAATPVVATSWNELRETLVRSFGQPATDDVIRNVDILMQRISATNPTNPANLPRFIDLSAPVSPRISELSQVLELLVVVCFRRYFVGREISSDFRILSRLLRMSDRRRDGMFTLCMRVLEVCLGNSQTDFCLSEIDEWDFVRFLRSLDPTLLGFSCRAVWRFLNDSDRTETLTANATTMLEREANAGIFVRAVDRNVSLILRVPELLERLCVILEMQEVPTGERIVDLLERYGISHQLGVTLSSSEVRWPEKGEIREVRPMRRIEGPEEMFNSASLVMAMTQNDVMTVMLTLLESGRWLEVQQRLRSAGIVQTLLRIWRAVDWDDPLTRDEERGERASTSQDANLRVQLCKMVQFLGGRGDAKRSLLSQAELEELRDTGEGETRKFLRPPERPEDEGLGCCVARLVVRCRRGSFVRHWALCALENWVRGSDRELQWWLARGGLVELFLQELLDAGSDARAVQIPLDMLAELTRFNTRSISLLQLCLDRFGREASFHDRVLNRPEDSTVLVRSLACTCFHLDRVHWSSPLVDPLGKWFRENRILLAFNCVSDLTVPKLYSDNMCCLNTFACLMVLEHQEGRLPRAVVDLVELSDRDSRSQFVSSLISLVEFWTVFYCQRAQDRISLQQSSHIAYSEWVVTLRELIEALKGIPK